MIIKRPAGFTLIELMITVVILAIIVGIAYPSYTQWMVQTRRSDAQIALTQAANQQERFFTECNTYATSFTAARNCTARGLGYTTTSSPDGHYNLGMTATNTSYIITATPVTGGLQDGDGTFRIDARGVKEWDRNNDGDFLDANEDSWTRR